MTSEENKPVTRPGVAPNNNRSNSYNNNAHTTTAHQYHDKSNNRPLNLSSALLTDNIPDRDRIIDNNNNNDKLIIPPVHMSGDYASWEMLDDINFDSELLSFQHHDHDEYLPLGEIAGLPKINTSTCTPEIDNLIPIHLLREYNQAVWGQLPPPTPGEDQKEAPYIAMTSKENKEANALNHPGYVQSMQREQIMQTVAGNGIPQKKVIPRNQHLYITNAPAVKPSFSSQSKNHNESYNVRHSTGRKRKSPLGMQKNFASCAFKTPKTSDHIGQAKKNVSSHVAAEGQVTAAVVESPTDLDVLLGRGGGSNNHHGNIQYRDELEKLKSTYRSESKDRKGNISQMVVDKVHQYGGRFLKKDETTGKWYEVSNQVARKKASQALREDVKQVSKKRRDNNKKIVAKAKARMKSIAASAAATATTTKKYQNQKKGELSREY